MTLFVTFALATFSKRVEVQALPANKAKTAFDIRVEIRFGVGKAANVVALGRWGFDAFVFYS